VFPTIDQLGSYQQAFGHFDCHAEGIKPSDCQIDTFIGHGRMKNITVINRYIFTFPLSQLLTVTNRLLTAVSNRAVAH
jgi:hypothetical protein